MKLRLVLGDQLSNSLASLSDVGTDDQILMCEVKEEATYVKHHKKKIVFVFSAMRHFAQGLRDQGLNVHYVAYDDPRNAGSLRAQVEALIQDHDISEIVLTKPGEFRLLAEFETWSDHLKVPVDLREDDRFLATQAEFAAWAEGRKQLRMEYFYREMRRKYRVLMDGQDPIGGQWNFDADNRRPPPKYLSVPEPFKALDEAVVETVSDVVAREFPDHFGDIHPFHFAVTREGALQALKMFINERLALFGDYQDAMVQGEPWMYHSHIGLYLNCGLLTPLECITRTEAAYHAGL
ncbi:MAG: cryptochrome/photolyase family protein, partial [Shimia sp.]|uniref:cryptochrome/photolyase family protein n=1 Tax=Shimia sp. TaxID=1954381 RepID=UPI0040597851